MVVCGASRNARRRFGKAIDSCPGENQSRRLDAARRELRDYQRQEWPQDRKRGGVPASHRGTRRELLFVAFSAHEWMDAKREFPMGDDQLGGVWLNHCSGEGSFPAEIHDVDPDTAAGVELQSQRQTALKPKVRDHAGKNDPITLERRRHGRGR